MRWLELIQFAGLLAIIGFIYRHSGPETHPSLASSITLQVLAGSFVLMLLTTLQARE